MSLLKCFILQNPSKTLFKTLYAHYYEDLTKLNNDLKTTNEKSETEEKNWINQSEVEERQKELESILPEVSNKKKLSKIQYDKLLDLILLSLYTLQKPRRNLDYLNMVVKKKLNDEGIEELQKVTRQALKGSTLIICGNFSVQIGISDKQLNKLTKFKSIRPYWNPKVNDWGIILKDNILDQGLSFTATFFRKKSLDIWYSSSKTTYQIDHILLPRKHIKLIRDVYRAKGCICGHIALRYKITFNKHIP